MATTSILPCHSISRLILPICFLSATSTVSAMNESYSGAMPQKREIYVPPDIEAMTADARMWYLTGVSNAKQNLNGFQPIVDGLQTGEDVTYLLKAQLKSLRTQVSDANDNTKVLVPKLTYLVDSFVSWTRDPSWLDKIKLKASLSYVKGKRDNKSYYLQNGAGLWCKLRLDMFPEQERTPKTNLLFNDLNNLEDKILLARDTLDDAAQKYVKGIAELSPLVSDIGSNEVRIRAIVDEMKSAMDESRASILKTANDAVKFVDAEIGSLNNSSQ